VVGKLVFQGLIAGILAGLLAFGFARVFGEPSVEAAVHFEAEQDEARSAAERAAGQAVEPEEPEMFTRATQSGIGLLTGVVVVGAGLGALFGVLFALAYGRIGSLGPGATSALLAFFGWLSVYLVPALKYPANPPAVGEPDTIRLRTALYFLMMAFSIAATVGAWILGLPRPSDRPVGLGRYRLRVHRRVGPGTSSRLAATGRRPIESFLRICEDTA
jgi:hypothetical protein